MPPADLVQFYAGYLPLLRANQLWFHGAHHTTKGVGFVGDHALYGDIYAAYEEEFDGATELAIPVCGEACAAPDGMAARLVKLIGPVPPDPVGAALAKEQEMVALLNETVAALRKVGLPIEVEQFLGDAALRHARFAYKLGQRAKVS